MSNYIVASNSELGAVPAPPLTEPMAGVIMSEGGTISLLGAAAAGYHGYQSSGRNVGQALLWAVFGFIFPAPTVGYAVYKGYGKR